MNHDQPPHSPDVPPIDNVLHNTSSSGSAEVGGAQVEPHEASPSDPRILTTPQLVALQTAYGPDLPDDIRNSIAARLQGHERYVQEQQEAGGYAAPVSGSEAAAPRLGSVATDTAVRDATPRAVRDTIGRARRTTSAPVSSSVPPTGAETRVSPQGSSAPGARRTPASASPEYRVSANGISTRIGRPRRGRETASQGGTTVYPGSRREFDALFSPVGVTRDGALLARQATPEEVEAFFSGRFSASAPATPEAAEAERRRRSARDYLTTAIPAELGMAATDPVGTVRGLRNQRETRVVSDTERTRTHDRNRKVAIVAGAAAVATLLAIGLANHFGWGHNSGGGGSRVTDGLTPPTPKPSDHGGGTGATTPPSSGPSPNVHVGPGPDITGVNADEQPLPPDNWTTYAEGGTSDFQPVTLNGQGLPYGDSIWRQEALRHPQEEIYHRVMADLQANGLSPEEARHIPNRTKVLITT